MLTPGTRLGGYEVAGSLGAGGMGEVYRATDLKLGRAVAIKVLADRIATDPDAVARFTREAKALAALNHPNIATLYGMEQSGDRSFLVMELVEGDTLADRIRRGGSMRVEDALPVARQIAEALEAAHEKGIVHRDLKPGNVKLTPDVQVKVLDFGLAKAIGPPEGAPHGGTAGPGDQTHSPTLSLMATQAGVIAGTVAYMSPEQAQGLPVDARSDIFSFGTVLYEMLTGRRPFQGETSSVVLASVLLKEPDLDALPPDLNPRLRELLKRCLEKQPRRRWQAAGDLRMEIETVASAPRALPAAPPPAPPRPLWRRALPALGVAVAASALTSVVWGRLATAPPAPGGVLRFVAAPPDGWSLVLGTTSSGAALHPLAISPDGTHMAMVARHPDGRERLWVRPLDSMAAREVAGSDRAEAPFWSPDSKSIAFFADGKLKKVDLSGGPPVTLCDIPEFRGGTWSRDGAIVFATTSSAALQKVSAAGGVPTPATQLQKGEASHIRPAFLPDGRHFAYRVQNGGTYIGSLDSTDRKVLFESPDVSNVVFVAGHLLFVRDTTLMAQPFDLLRLEPAGDPVPIAEQIQTSATPPVAVFSASNTGILVYQPASGVGGSQLTWFDRSGKPLSTVGERAAYGDLTLSADGRRATVSIFDPAVRTRDIWIVDLARGLRSRFTFDRADDRYSIWSPGGDRVVFGSFRNGPLNLFQKATGGGGIEEPLSSDSVNQAPFSWSPDGKVILYGTGTDLFLLPLSADRKAVPFLPTPFTETMGQFSPDGRWVAYVSNDSGPNQVYVVPFPGPGGRVQVSANGGTWPRWRRDGSEIFYLGPDNLLMAASVTSRSGGFEVGAVQPLFKLGRGGVRSVYDVAQDGRRFLVSALREEVASLPATVVVNWTAALPQ